MQATIYVTAEALATTTATKDLDYFDRMSLTDEASDLSMKEGWYLKEKMRMAARPDDANIALRILPSNGATYTKHVSAPANLRGCIFEKAGNIPDRYGEILAYWTGATINTNCSGAAFHQSPNGNAYMVDLSVLDANPELAISGQNVPGMDALLSESVVLCLSDIGSLVADAPADAFVEIEIAIDEAMLGLDNGSFFTAKEYDLLSNDRSERIWLKISDIRNSPDPDRLYLDALRYCQINYGFYY
jgi:hypothetical protein